jgi:hypothetical protein
MTCDSHDTASLEESGNRIPQDSARVLLSKIEAHRDTPEDTDLPSEVGFRGRSADPAPAPGPPPGGSFTVIERSADSRLQPEHDLGTTIP